MIIVRERSKTIFSVLIGMVAVSIFFRTTIISKFSTVTGFGSDSLIDVSIMEHWYNYFLGYSQWNVVNYFAPYRDTLGYNDGYFIHGVIFSIFRTLHFNLFVAKELSLITFTFIGYFSFYALLKYLKFSATLSVLGSLIFIFSNSIQLHILHSQNLTLFLSPLLTLLILKSYEYFIEQSTLKCMLYITLTSLLFGAWLVTAYYFIWFYIYFFSVFAVTYLIHHIRYEQLKFALSDMFSSRQAKACLLFGAAIFLLSLIPFLLVYLPKLHETGGHHYVDAKVYLPDFLSFLDIGTGNYVFGRLYQLMHATISYKRHCQYDVGFSYVYLLFVLVALISNFKNKRQFVLSFAIIISTLFVLKVGHHSLWVVVYKFFPGAKGLRAISRYLIFLTFPLTLLLLYYFREIGRKYKKIPIILSLIIIASSINTPLNGMNPKALLSKYDAFSLPPTGCQLFYVMPRDYQFVSEYDGLSVYDHNVDAMFLAEKWHLRTINGFSTFNPKKWQFSAFPIDTYKQRVFLYLKENKLDHHVCALNLETKQWILI